MPSVYIKKADRIEMNKKQPVPFKRPRGRPPLSAKRKFEVLEQHNDKANFTAEKLQQNISSTATQKSSTHTHDIDDNAKKISRSQSIVQSIIDILLTSEPSTLSRIASRIPEASKEFVQSTLEILQILGIAVQIKQRESSKSKLMIVYTIVNFSRCSEAVDIRQITEAIEQKKKNLEKIQSRISLLKVSVTDPSKTCTS
jgi:hypothetical protein